MRRFGHVMQMREEKISKKMLHRKMEGNDQEEDTDSYGQIKLERI